MFLEDDVRLSRVAGALLVSDGWIPADAQVVKLEHYGPPSQRVLLEGFELWLDNGSGASKVPPADDLPAIAPMPPPSELLHTAYDMWHSTGMDLAPYTRLYTVMRERILGHDVAEDPTAGTFVDGVANQAVVDAIRASDTTGARVEVAR